MNPNRLMKHLTAAALLVFAGLAAGACTSPPAQEPAAPGSAATSAAPGASTAEADKDDEAEEAEEAAGDAEEGKTTFGKTCASCHGPDAKGLPGLGKDLHANVFVAGLSDAEMVAFLKVGRPASDPLNTTHVDMPPKGGNPALKDEDLADVVAFLRTLKE